MKLPEMTLKISDTIKRLEELDFDLEYRVNNSNELYVRIKAKQIRKLAAICISEFRFNFIAEFCRQETDKCISSSYIINCIFSNSKQGYYVILSYTTEKEIISLQDLIYQSRLFEREIADLFGMKILNGIDTRPIVKHEEWQKDVYPLRKEYLSNTKVQMLNEIPDYKFKEVSGDGAYQIAVGPVHAGIIEPGHFRFSVMGEPIENLEIRLMYKHRGIEKLCENTDANMMNLIFERVSGESTVAYGEAYALLVEKFLNKYPSDEIKALRVVFLELERMYNFLDDLSGIGMDIGYSYVSKKFGYFSELIHQLCERVSRSRFMRNVIVPLGINIDFTQEQKEDIISTLKSIKERIFSVIEMSLESVSFLDRVEDTGNVDRSSAKRLCLTGVSGRACNLKYDVRVMFPYELYKQIKKEINIECAGGVFERYKLKIHELEDAFIFIEDALMYINSDLKRNKQEIHLEEGLEAIVAVETVKGELVVYARTGIGNKFDRIYFKTPSFTNWLGLSEAVLGEIIPDFPLCNKSFNMSYSENDR